MRDAGLKETGELIKEKLEDIALFVYNDIILWPADKIIELSLNKGMKMTIKWLKLLPTAGFDVSEYEIPQDSTSGGGMIEVFYKGRKVLEMSNSWSYFYLVSFVEYLDAEEVPNWGQLDPIKITSKKDLVRYLESVRETVYPDLNKLNVMDLLLDVAQDL